MGGTDKHRPSVGLDVIDAVGDREPQPLGAEVMIFHRDGLFVPCRARVFEIAHQFFLFCVHTDHRQPPSGETTTNSGYLLELRITILTGTRRYFLVIQLEEILWIVR